MILKRICQLSLTRITHQVSRAFDLNIKAGSTIVVSCYVYDDRYHHVGIRRPDGSMLYVNGMHQVTKTFNCETTGTYYVYVENMRSKQIRAAGYFIK